MLLAFPALRRALFANVFYKIWLFLALMNQEQPNLATISEQTFLLKVLQEASVPPVVLPLSTLPSIPALALTTWLAFQIL